MTGERAIYTGGGAVVGDGVQTGGGAFVGRDQYITINVAWQGTPFVLQEPDLARLRADYLAYLRQAYQFLDFKGVPQVAKIAQQLSLDAVYVPLRARPEMPRGETWLRIAGREWVEDAAPGDKQEVIAREAAGPVEPVFIDRALADAPALVILGDPGAGKSTLLKVLALGLARKKEGPLPILVPLNAYAAALERQEISLHDFVSQYFGTRQGCLQNLAPLFDAALEAGQAVVLLDGLDEVQTQRPFLVRLVQDFCAEHVPVPAEEGTPVRGNRLVATSRIVGYRDAPLNGPRWRTYTLVDFGQKEIERFVERWTVAFEMATSGDTKLARDAARHERDALLDAIRGSTGIERLASNPLLLTILALIKRQGVTLPQRRVELYELYLRTLIDSWNKARSLDQRPVGPEMDYLETVQVLAPLGLWLRETNPTAGLVSRAEIEGWLALYFGEEWALAPGPARQRARAFLNAVRSYSNLLVERGQGQYGFLHLTFEEMLAAKGIAALAQLGPRGAVEAIVRHLADPAWHETIMLAVGALGIVGQQPRAAGEVLNTLCQVEVAGADRGYNVVLAGEALLDVGEVGVGRKAAVRVTGCLVETMQNGEVTPRLRREAGLVLGRLGWTPEDLEAFVEIPPGPFVYGESQERTIDHRYWIAKYPVTNGQYARFVADGGYEDRALWSEEGWAWRSGVDASLDQISDEDLRKAYENRFARRPVELRHQPFWWEDAQWNNPIFPVVGVCWFEAEAYCTWLTAQLREGAVRGAPALPDGYAARLPAEEEWERAVRGTDGREYPWGDEMALQRLNAADGWAGKVFKDDDEWLKWDVPDFAGTTAVCTYPQGVNEVGVWDGAGNVWEWMASWYDRERGPRVLRGGSWNYAGRDARCAFRDGDIGDNWNDFSGLRVSVSLAGSES